MDVRVGIRVIGIEMSLGFGLRNYIAADVLNSEDLERYECGEEKSSVLYGTFILTTCAE